MDAMCFFMVKAEIDLKKFCRFTLELAMNVLNHRKMMGKIMEIFLMRRGEKIGDKMGSTVNGQI